MRLLIMIGLAALILFTWKTTRHPADKDKLSDEALRDLDRRYRQAQEKRR